MMAIFSHSLLCFGLMLLSLSMALAAPANMRQSEEYNVHKWAHAWPFHRILNLGTDGKDVVVLQNLLRRHHAISSLAATGVFNKETKKALQIFQKAEHITPADGVLGPVTGKKVIELLMHDGYRDNGIVPDDCKFKLHVPLHRDRNKESIATLYKCGNGGEVLHTFKIRSRGGTRDGHPLNQLTSNGDTPTGLSTCDLNSREPPELVKSFGPFPVFRVVKGIEGNVAIGKDEVTSNGRRDTFLSNYRFGILLHTGIWDDWDKNKPMPNSLGCMHAHPDDQKKIVDLVINMTNTIVRENPFGKVPYPYKPQGIISIEEID